jgi:hypothetical protein
MTRSTTRAAPPSRGATSKDRRTGAEASNPPIHSQLTVDSAGHRPRPPIPTNLGLASGCGGQPRGKGLAALAGAGAHEVILDVGVDVVEVVEEQVHIEIEVRQ